MKRWKHSNFAGCIKNFGGFIKNLPCSKCHPLGALSPRKRRGKRDAAEVLRPLRALRAVRCSSSTWQSGPTWCCSLRLYPDAHGPSYGGVGPSYGGVRGLKSLGFERPRAVWSVWVRLKNHGSVGGCGGFVLSKRFASFNHDSTNSMEALDLFLRVQALKGLWRRTLNIDRLELHASTPV